MSSNDDSGHTNEFKQKFEKLKQKIFERRPILQEIMRKHGEKSLYDYAKEYVEVNINPPVKRRQEEFIGTLKEEVERLLGKKIAESVEKQLYKHYFVSTCDHHGPVTSPFFINSNLLTSLPYENNHDKDLKNIVVLSCSNVTVNNSSFPRGLLFNTYKDGQITTHKLPILPANSRLPVYNFRPYVKEEIEKIKVFLKEWAENGKFSKKIAEKLGILMEEIYLKPEIFECKNFADQITLTNVELWKKYFEGSGFNPPNLIYIEQESLTAKLLIKHHLYEDTILNHIIFDESYEPLVKKYFDNIMGAFSEKDKYGTYLFWAMPEGAKQRVQLWKKGKMLVADDGSYSIEITPENIKRALESRELIPSLLLNFSTISFYYGVKCLGGFNQVNYLTEMKNNYIKMNVDRGNYKSIEVCARAQTKEIIDGPIIAYLGGLNGEMFLATGLDLILYGDDKMWRTLVNESKEVTLAEAIYPQMPEMYSIMYPENERESDLAGITAEDITNGIGLSKKIQACVTYQDYSDKTTEPPSPEERGITLETGLQPSL